MSSLRRIRRNECKGKVRHASADAARCEIRAVIKKMRGAIGFLQPYKCQFCNGFHIGHKDSRSARW